ncbi:hypothetical protein GGR51DRAFT_568911 [Nemania sp. FL0031]|nr:hypothetical protein GGR51DRAFT_568911 [Nemania sp. FL0031]
MQTKAILGALFVAAASGAAVKSRDAAFYNVFGFSATCTTASELCGYGFRVVPSTDTPGSNGTICGNLVVGPYNFPPLDLTACFTNPKIAYSIGIANGGLSLTITSALNEHTNITGTYEASADDIILEKLVIDNVTTFSQTYIGTNQFTIVAEEVAV